MRSILAGHACEREDTREKDDGQEAARQEYEGAIGDWTR